MKAFHKIAAQGEITLIRLGGAPKRAEKIAGKPLFLEGGKMIIGHSETGHHHVLEHTRGASVMVLDRVPEGMRILRAILEEPNKLIHERDHDTHETIELQPGEYEFRIAREFDHYAELARQSVD